MPPAFERRKEHEEIGGAGFNTSDISDVSYAFVFVIGSRETSRFHRDVCESRVSAISCFEASSKQTSGTSGSRGRR